jgi:hypothetical protein
LEEEIDYFVNSVMTGKSLSAQEDYSAVKTISKSKLSISDHNIQALDDPTLLIIVQIRLDLVIDQAR